MATEIVMPAMEMAQDTGTLVRWLKDEGELVRKGEPLMEIETDKVTLEIEAPADGRLSDVRARAGETLPVGAVIGLLLRDDETRALPDTVVAASPVAHRLAAEHQLDLSEVSASGRRIRKDDVLQFLAARQPGAAENSRLTPASPKARRLSRENDLELAAIKGTGPGGAVLAADIRAKLSEEDLTVSRPVEATENTSLYRVVPLTNMRETIARRMQQSYQTAPHVSLSLSVNMREALRLVKHLKSDISAESRHPLTVTALIAKAIGIALIEHPRLNAHFVGKEIHEYSTVNLGIAVALGDGLMVPVIKHIERKRLFEIQSELSELASRARARTLNPTEIKDSTFTLSNLGMFGVEHFNSILNPPEVGILAVGTIFETAVKKKRKVAFRPTMQITLSVDHRAVDGAVGAAFLKKLKETLENPYLIMV